MTIQTEALKLALEALEESHPEAYRHVITAIKEALAQPEQEPVAWVCYGSSDSEMHDIDFEQKDVDALPVGTMLYTTPPQRTWVGLTDEEIEMIVENKRAAHWEFVRQVEALLKEKNT